MNRDLPLSIALFGTSADPPTLAHAAILTGLAARFDHVAVWASDNPFKAQQTPLHHRAQMLRLLLAGLPCGHVSLEQDLSHPRAWVTLQRAQDRWPHARFTLIIGSDLVPQLPRWYRSADLLACVNLLIVPRPGYPLGAADLALLHQLGARYQLADLVGLPISSSAYREGEQDDGVSAPVQAYIEQEQLYPCPDVAIKT